MVKRDLYSGKWWHFDRYIVRSGFICPAPKAKLKEYDPWEQYWSSQRKHGKDAVASPYVKLLNSYNSLPDRKDKGQRRTHKDQTESLLEWCAEFGLLGVLLQRVQRVVLAPRWQPDLLTWAPGRGSGKRRTVKLLRPQLCEYLRVNDGWMRVRSVIADDPDTGIRVETKKLLASLVQQKDRPRNWPNSSATVLDSITGRVWRQEPLARSWGTFFPGVPPREREVYMYPVPGSEEFWRAYCEPIESISGAVAILRGIFEALGALKDGDPDWEKDEGLTFEPLLQLNALITSVNPVLSVERRTVTWQAPSLLSALSIMMVQDFLGESRLLCCEGCGNAFTAVAYQKLYCSSTCRQRIVKRRQRSR